MNPFEALGIGMQRIGTWLMDLRCRVFGHRWEAEEVDYGNGFGNVYVGDVCRWCFKVEPYTYRANVIPESEKDAT